jgi:hypothetical protein
VNSIIAVTRALTGLNLRPSIDRRTRSEVVTAEVLTDTSIPLPITTDETFADDIQAQGQHEQNQPDEEQRLEGGNVARDLI